ncbi:hypothetical protein LCGC14_2546830 [marine sediment metagenome]|uniref:DUF1376 domain-containing protein n=1 Tax=marine sediment metagenome TaxID=412755 RepID=A0A0F9AP28_9ZZZZ
MDFYPGDYLRDTAHLTTQEHGAYLLLIFHYWGRFSPPKDDDVMLARIINISLRQWKRIRPVIQEFFDVRDGKWFHYRIEAEMRKASDIMMKRSEAGKKSDAKRNTCSTHDEHMGCGPSPSPSPSPSKDLKVKNNVLSEAESTTPAKHKYTSLFEEFWKAYPVKRGKGAAFKAYKRARASGVNNAALIAAISEARQKSPEWAKGYIQHPATWLNQRGWENEFTEEASSGNAPGERSVKEDLDEYFGHNPADPVPGNQ